MGFNKTNFIERIHCPNCNCMNIIIDKEIISCPECEINFYSTKVKTHEDNLKKKLVQFQF
jgi:hypothetical protein